MYHLADLIVRVKNSHLAGIAEFTITFSSIKKAVLEVMKKYGYIKDFKSYKEGQFKYLKIIMDTEESPISDLKVISKPGRRVYTSKFELSKDKKGKGIYIISTSKGVMSSKDALKQKVGGEILCRIW